MSLGSATRLRRTPSFASVVLAAAALVALLLWAAAVPAAGRALTTSGTPARVTACAALAGGCTVEVPGVGSVPLTVPGPLSPQVGDVVDVTVEDGTATARGWLALVDAGILVVLAGAVTAWAIGAWRRWLFQVARREELEREGHLVTARSTPNARRSDAA